MRPFYFLFTDSTRTSNPRQIRTTTYGSTVNFSLLVVVPPGLVTLIEPLVAPAGTVVVMNSEPGTLKVAEVPLNLTDVAPIKGPRPMVTFVPTFPEDGTKPKIPGFGTGKLALNTSMVPWSGTPLELTPPPDGAVTYIFPSLPCTNAPTGE